MARQNPMTAAEKQALGAAVAHFRELATLTTAQAARRAGITPTNLHRIERGQAEPHWGTMRRIAAAVGAPLDDVVREAERREAELTRRDSR